MTTTEFYNINSVRLINRYDDADMSSLHRLLLKHIPEKSCVLDIGFGSSRDLQFLSDNGYDIWGMDPSAKFVQNAKKRFPLKKNQFFEVSIPFDKYMIDLCLEFNAIISIAMWMHLERSLYEAAVQSIVNVARSTSTVIISYSDGSRVGDERFFENVDLEYLSELFIEKGFSLVETIRNEDSLDRDSLTWLTVVYKR